MDNTENTPDWIWDDYIKPLLPKSTSIYYVDYRDRIEDKDTLFELISNPAKFEEDFWESNIEWTRDSEYQDWLSHKKDLSSGLSRVLMSELGDDDDDFIGEIIDQYEYKIRDHLLSVDDSTPISDILRNIGDITVLYGVDCDINTDWSSDQEERKEQLDSIKSALNISPDDTKYDDAIMDCINNAGYGGSLKLYIDIDCRQYYNDWIESQKEGGHEPNVIEFKDACIGIVDHGNGSGFVTNPIFCGRLPFNRANLVYSKAYSYSWKQICGQSAEGGSAELIYDPEQTDIPDASGEAEAKIERERKLDETFRNGGCTPGDMNINRHRNTPYSIDYPAGNRCTQCGTFWID